MTNAENLAKVVTALGGTPSGRTNAELLAEIVAALGGTPAPGASNDELIAQVAEHASGGGEWRLWDGEEPLVDVTTRKWLVDCEIYARYAVPDIDGAPVLECKGFWRMGGQSISSYTRSLTLGGDSREPYAGGDYLVITGIGAISVSSLTPEDGIITGEGVYYPYSATDIDDIVNIDPLLALNDEEQPDRIMVWVRRGLRATRSRGNGPPRREAPPP